MQLRFIGKDKSLGLEHGKIYDVEINARYELVWATITWDHRYLSCPYSSIRALLDNWEEI